MISFLMPYKKYKTTELPWAPLIPEHWDLVPTRSLIQQRKVLVGNRHKKFKLLSLTKKGIIIRDISTGKGKFSSDMGTSQEVRKGDLVFCLFDVPETPRTVGLSSHDGMITGAYTVFESINKDIEVIAFLEKFYIAMDDGKFLSPLYSGLRNTIPKSSLLGARTPIPPPNEQSAIIEFLNYISTKIDNAIRAKLRIIELLHEQKLAVIHQATTKGLKPKVECKTSGVNWLGEIPSHWDCRAFARLSRVVRGASPRPAGDPRYFHGNHTPWVTVGEITKDSEIYLKETSTFLTKQGVKNSVLFKKGTLILSNSGATLGVPKILDIDACANDGVVAFLNLDKILLPEFAYFYLASITQRLREELKQGGTQPNLNTQIVKGITCPIPPISEQKEILRYLTDSSQKIDRSISTIKTEISLLLELRTTVTMNVVTGKLDVREAAKRLSNQDENIFTSKEMMLEDEADPEAMEELNEN